MLGTRATTANSVTGLTTTSSLLDIRTFNLDEPISLPHDEHPALCVLERQISDRPLSRTQKSLLPAATWSRICGEGN